MNGLLPPQNGRELYEFAKDSRLEFEAGYDSALEFYDENWEQVSGTIVEFNSSDVNTFKPSHIYRHARKNSPTDLDGDSIEELIEALDISSEGLHRYSDRRFSRWEFRGDGHTHRDHEQFRSDMIQAQAYEGQTETQSAITEFEDETAQPDWRDWSV